MAVQINAKPLAGFDRPLDMLIDCHRRIEHLLAVIVRVVERYNGQVLDAEGRQAIAATKHYFANSAPKHTADEELRCFHVCMRRVSSSQPRTSCWSDCGKITEQPTISIRESSDC